MATESYASPVGNSSIPSGADGQLADCPENSARRLVTDAKTTLSEHGAMKHLKRSLRRKLHVLQEQKVYKRDIKDGDLEEIVVDGWINELLRFLAIKSLVGDTTKPFQIMPGEPIAVAWEALMVMPSYYANVCFAMGNDNVIDHDPFDFNADVEEEKHRLKRYNATLRLYQQFFDEQAPHLYWKEPSLEKSAVEIFFESALQKMSCAGFPAG
uniref:Uncharacterized protein n=1 Tax=Odontella aurita TaxID=265563 RepID=A0A7S4MXV3_9STRA|mmetsp:Transcript_37749/g.112970  ORF Transcript_37749/g.112970 Transcript_37749/m.112970 type:complete len:212 (+) Transcript_37749:407-1042(+)